MKHLKNETLNIMTLFYVVANSQSTTAMAKEAIMSEKVQRDVRYYGDAKLTSTVRESSI